MQRRIFAFFPLFVAIGFGLMAGWYFFHNTTAGERLAAAPGGLRGLLNESYEFTDLRVVSAVLVKVRDLYLDPAQAQPQEMLEGALKGAEQANSELLFVQEDGRIRVIVGDKDRSIPLGELNSINDLAGLLRSLALVLDDLLPEDTERVYIEYGLANGMLHRLDPHSHLLIPDDYEDMQTDNVGSFGGLGISIQNIDRKLTITCPIDGTPAQQAGLLSGDVISRIEQVSTTNMPISEAVRRLRGPIGDPVTILVEREGMDPFESTVVRASISLPHIESLYLGDGVGYIRLRKFFKTAYSGLQTAILELGREAGRPLDGLVLDLRSNPGGYLTQAEEVSDLFLSKGGIVSVVGPEDERGEVTTAKAFGTESDLRLAVLINTDTASASEIVAGALRDNDRAVIMGARSFGKGSVQHLWPFPGGEGLKLTTAEYLTGGGASIQGTGIIPDIELRPGWVEDESVRLYFQDALFRESSMERALSPRWKRTGVKVDARSTRPPSMVLHYLEPNLASDAPPRDRFACRGVREMEDDAQVKMARTLLTHSSVPVATQMLLEAGPVLEEESSELTQQLLQQIGARGYRWTPASWSGEAKVKLQARVDGGDPILTAGEDADIEFSLTNKGQETLPALHGWIESDMRWLHGEEILFGDVAPGQTVTTLLNTTVPPDTYSLVEEIQVHVSAGDGAELTVWPVRIRVRELAMPQFGLSVSLVDDGSGTSKGNGDGQVDPGESIDVAVTVRNIGEAPTGDRWLKEWWHRNNDGRSQRKSVKEGACYITVWETSGSSLYFPIDGGGGSCSGWDEDMEFSAPLEPGEERRLRFHFDAPTTLMVDAPDGSEMPASATHPVKLHVTVRDQALWSNADEELTIVPPNSAPELRPGTKKLGAKTWVMVHAAAAKDSKVIAHARGSLKGDGRVGEFWRISLPWGIPGFVARQDLGAARGKGEPEFVEQLAQRPPIIRIKNDIDHLVSREQVKIEGHVEDADGIGHLLVFVNGDKLRVLTPKRSGVVGKERLDFSISLPMEPGVNAIELIAADTLGTEASRYLAVFREGENSSAK